MFIFAGCTTNLYVVDEYSNPVSDATVVVIPRRHMTANYLKTGNDGKLTVPKKPFSIVINKDGFHQMIIDKAMLKQEPYIVVLRYKKRTLFNHILPPPSVENDPMWIIKVEKNK